MDLESSGLTPIDVAFLQSVMMNAHLPKSVETEVYLVTSSEDEFIRCYLDKMEENKEGRFQRSKRAESLSLKTFLCERHEKPRGKSQGNPSKTRANSCKSYVSFKFTGDGIRKACLVRKNTKHSGHCLDNRQEWKVNRIHPNLIEFIKKLSKEGIKKEEIVTRVKNWSLKNQVADCIDRRFYPTSQDIRYLMTRVPRKEKTHEAEASIATISKMESQKDEDSRNVDSNSEASEKTFGVGMKWQSEDADAFKYIILKKQICVSHRHEEEFGVPENLASSQETEKEPNIKMACPSMNPGEEPTASTQDLMSSSLAALPQTSTSNIFALKTQTSLDDVPTPPSPDILLSLTPQQILPSLPQTLISNKDPNILPLSSSPKALASTHTQTQETLNREAAKVEIPFFSESAQSTNEIPEPVTEINAISTETTSSQILLPQFVEITSPMKLISTNSDNGQLIAPKRFSSSNMIATNFTNAPASITMTTEDTLPISLAEISPSTVTISLSKGDSSLSTVGLTLSSDGLLLTADGLPFTTDSILTTNQEIEASGKFAEEISSTTPLPIYTLHYNSLRDDSGAISCSSSKSVDQKSETNFEENNSNLEENILSKKTDKEFTEIVGSIVDASFLPTGEALSNNGADCLQQSSENLTGDIEQNPNENSSELATANQEPYSQKNTEKGEKPSELEETEKCNMEDKVLTLANETSKISCLVHAKNKGKKVKLSLTDEKPSQSLKSATVKDFNQSESSQLKDSKQQPKNKLIPHIKRTKPDTLLEQPLKKRRVLGQIRPRSGKQRKKASPVSNNSIHTQLKSTNVSGKKVFSYTTPLLLYNISQGRLHRLGITEDEMRRRTSPPEKLNLRALQALLQTHKKKQWKQNLKNKMLDSSITVNEGQSGYLTAFTRLSEEEASHLEFELLKMVANPNHVKINSIVQELVTEAIPSIEKDQEIQAKNYLKNLQVTRRTLDEIYKKFVLHSENFSLITHTFGTSCMGVMKSVFDDILEKTMQRTMEEIGNA